jgi:hypothetical protein
MPLRDADVDAVVIHAITSLMEGDELLTELEPSCLAASLQIGYGDLDRSLSRLEERGFIDVVRHGLPSLIDGYVVSEFYPMQAISVVLNEKRGKALRQT